MPIKIPTENASDKINVARKDNLPDECEELHRNESAKY